MNFDDVKKDIHKLIGLELESIRPGATIIIVDVDDEKGSLSLKTSSGQLRSRPIDELQKIWDEMMISPAVHVEGVLHGSGTSRNQPETILASLPYVEWLKVDKKKHITYVGKDTHPFGTLRQMDAVSAVELTSKMKGSKVTSNFNMVIAAKDINQSISALQDICHGTLSTLDRGIYQFETQTDRIVFLSADILGVEEGTYCIIETSQKVNAAKRLCLYGKYYSIISNGNVKALVKEK